MHAHIPASASISFYLDGSVNEDIMTVVTHKLLRDKIRKGRIRGNWRVLSGKEKALFNVSLAYTKPIVQRVIINGRLQKTRMGRTIVETRLVQKLEALFGKLLETRGMKIFKRGFEKAVELLQRCGSVVWASSLPQWLKDPDFIFWLGTNVSFQKKPLPKKF